MTTFEEEGGDLDQRQPAAPRQGPDRLRWHPIYPQQTEPGNTAPQPPVQPRQGSNIAGLVALVFLGIAVALGVTQHEHIAAFLRTVDSIGSGTPEQQTRGLVAVGLIGVLIVAIVRMVTRKN